MSIFYLKNPLNRAFVALFTAWLQRKLLAQQTERMKLSHWSDLIYIYMTPPPAPIKVYIHLHTVYISFIKPHLSPSPPFSRFFFHRYCIF